MLTFYNFDLIGPLSNDMQDDTWSVRLDSTTLGNFPEEAKAIAFIEYLVSLEMQREAYKKYSEDLLKDFKGLSQY